MDFLLNNWDSILLVVVLLAVLVYLVIAQRNKVTAWMLYAVTEAESFLGSETGQLKLVMVYDMFVERFKWISAVVPYAVFCAMVDTALDCMNDMIKQNTVISNIVVGTDEVDDE